MIRTLLVLMLLSLLSAPVLAQAPLLQPADALLSETLRRHGGARLNEVVRIRLRGTSQTAKESQPVAISASQDGGRRIDYGRNGDRASVTTPTGSYLVRDGAKTFRPSHVGVFAQWDIFSVLGIRNTFGNGGDRGVVGNRELKGAPTVLVRTGRDREKNFYNRIVKDAAEVQLDARTGLVAAVHRVQYADDSLDRHFTTSYLFSDYREVDGILLPFHIERYHNLTLMETLLVEAYDINPAFDPDLFTR